MNAPGRGGGGVVVRVGFGLALIFSRSPLASLLNYETIQYQTKTDNETNVCRLTVFDKPADLLLK